MTSSAGPPPAAAQPLPAPPYVYPPAGHQTSTEPFDPPTFAHLPTGLMSFEDVIAAYRRPDFSAGPIPPVLNDFYGRQSRIRVDLKEKIAAAIRTPWYEHVIRLVLNDFYGRCLAMDGNKTEAVYCAHDENDLRLTRKDFRFVFEMFDLACLQVRDPSTEELSNVFSSSMHRQTAERKGGAFLEAGKTYKLSADAGLRRPDVVFLAHNVNEHAQFPFNRHQPLETSQLELTGNQARHFLESLLLTDQPDQPDQQYHTAIAPMVGELQALDRKGGNVNFIRGFFQTIGYLSGSHHACGTRLAVFHYGEKFARILCLEKAGGSGELTLVIPCLPFQGWNGEVPYSLNSFQDFEDFLKDSEISRNTLTNTLYGASTELGKDTIDKDGAKVLYDMVSLAFSLIKDQSLRHPLQRLPSLAEDVLGSTGVVETALDEEVVLSFDDTNGQVAERRRRSANPELASSLATDNSTSSMPSPRHMQQVPRDVAVSPKSTTSTLESKSSSSNSHSSRNVVQDTSFELGTPPDRISAIGERARKAPAVDLHSRMIHPGSDIHHPNDFEERHIRTLPHTEGKSPREGKSRQAMETDVFLSNGDSQQEGLEEDEDGAEADDEVMESSDEQGSDEENSDEEWLTEEDEEMEDSEYERDDDYLSDWSESEGRVKKDDEKEAEQAKEYLRKTKAQFALVSPARFMELLEKYREAAGVAH